MIPFKTGERKVLGVAAPNQPTNLTSLYPPPPNPFNLQPRLTGYVNSIYVQATAQDRFRPRSTTSTGSLCGAIASSRRTSRISTSAI